MACTKQIKKNHKQNTHLKIFDHFNVNKRKYFEFQILANIHTKHSKPFTEWQYAPESGKSTLKLKIEKNKNCQQTFDQIVRLYCS